MATERNSSTLVAAGILLSRVSGLVRQKIFAHYFGNSDAGDAFYAALKIPNFLQNLLGDGILSASFIPVYASLLARGERKKADEVAGAVGAILATVVSTLVLIGVLVTPYLIDVIAPGFHGEKRELTIRLVQIFFPGTGVIVLSAWCLGVLNSHRKFFLSYAAPVAWNFAFIAALLIFGHRGPHTPEGQSALAVYTAWGVFVGSILQFGVQFPTVLRCAPELKFALAFQMAEVREILRNLTPVVIARGVVQISAYVDNVLASLLPGGAVSALGYAQALYMLPVSLFGMSVSAAELPAMSSVQGDSEDIAKKLRVRVNAGLLQISYFVLPSVVGFLALGDVIVAGLYQGGEFRYGNTVYVWGVLAGSTVGLLATTMGRLYSSVFYSLKDTRRPLNFALIRVMLTTSLGYFCGVHLPGLLGINPAWGTAGLTASAGVSGWVEFLLLRRKLGERIGTTGLPLAYVGKLWVAALLAAAVGYGIKLAAGGFGVRHPIVNLFLVLGPYGVMYLGATMLLRVEQARALLRRFGLRGIA